MKYIVRKPYWNYEKEEKWLNEMSAKGMALTDYSWCRYVFEEAPYNEYIYRIELLNNAPSNAESMAYIKFLEENGIEFVASYMRWIYLRKKSNDGEFDIYSDIDSKIAHYKRILLLWYPLMYIEFIIGFMNLLFVAFYFLNLMGINFFPTGNFVAGSLTVGVGLIFWAVGRPISKKLKKLKKEKSIRE